MGIGDILEGAGSAIEPGYGQNPYLPAVGSALAGGLSGFAAGRASRRKLAAADKMKRLEAKLGFPVDVLARLSHEAQTSILERAGYGRDTGLDEPLPQFDNMTMGELLKHGAPASVTQPPSGTGIFEGVPGGPQQDLGGQQLPRTNPAIPPLSAVNKADVPGLLSSRFGSAMPADPGADARTRASTLQGDKTAYELQNILPAQLENLGKTGRATDALTRSRNIRADLAKEASLGAAVPSWLVDQIDLGGINLPKDQPVNYRALDYAMKNSGGFQELNQIIEEATGPMIDQARNDPSFSKKDVRDFARSQLGGRLKGASLQFSTKPDLAMELFVDRVWQAVQHSRNMPDTQGEVPTEDPYSIPGIDSGE